MKRALIALVLAATTAGTSGAHADARSLILTCEKAITAARVGPAPASSSALTRARAAEAKCEASGHMANLMLEHKGDKAIHDASYAYAALEVGVVDYVRYCGNITSSHTLAVLHRAEREIAQGRSEAKQALAEL